MISDNLVCPFDVCPPSNPFSIPYLVPIARRIYDNPEISSAGLNTIFYKGAVAMNEVGNELCDDRQTQLSNRWSWSPCWKTQQDEAGTQRGAARRAGYNPTVSQTLTFFLG